MWARARSESGFTTIELLLALMVASVGVISLVGTMDMSRRLATFSEMKEAASHVAEQKIEEMRALDYGELALDGDPSPASSTDPNDPAYHLGAGTAGQRTYRWNQKASAPAGHTEPLVIDSIVGKVPAVAEAWTDGRLGGKIYRYVTCAGTTSLDCAQGPSTTAYKRITVAVTVENKLGPEKPILISTVVGDPDAANGEGSNPLESPNTRCESGGTIVQCSGGVSGTVRTWYLYDTPATFETRQEISGSHPTHPTVAPAGTCTGSDASGCPVPDLMALDPPPAPTVTPPVYDYSSEITGGSSPGGAVIRRDAACGASTTTTTDNTKGHLWVSDPLEDPMVLSGDAAMSISTQTFNGVTAKATLCVRFLAVPGDMSNLVVNPPIPLGNAGYTRASWPRTPTNLGFRLDFLDASSVAIPAGHRLGVRVWVSSASEADLVLLYDHPMHPTMVQINEKS